ARCCSKNVRPASLARAVLLRRAYLCCDQECRPLRTHVEEFHKDPVAPEILPGIPRAQVAQPVLTLERVRTLVRRPVPISDPHPAERPARTSVRRPVPT